MFYSFVKSLYDPNYIYEKTTPCLQIEASLGTALSEKPANKELLAAGGIESLDKSALNPALMQAYECVGNKGGIGDWFPKQADACTQFIAGVKGAEETIQKERCDAMVSNLKDAGML